MEVLIFIVAVSALKYGIAWGGATCNPEPGDFELALAPRQELHFAPYFCKNETTSSTKSFSPWTVLFFNPLNSALRAVLCVADVDAFPAISLFAAFMFYGAMMILTYGIAAPAGIFSPGFAVGAIMGRLIGVLVSMIFTARTDVSIQSYAFLGSVAATGGITRDISVAVIALEATGGFQASFAAAIVVLVSKLVSDALFGKGIYDLQIVLKGIPFLPERIPYPQAYRRIRVGIISSNHLIGVRRRTLVKKLIEVLTSYDYHAFPVFRKVKASYYAQDTTARIYASELNKNALPHPADPQSSENAATKTEGDQDLQKSNKDIEDTSHLERMLNYNLFFILLKVREKTQTRHRI